MKKANKTLDMVFGRNCQKSGCQKRSCVHAPETYLQAQGDILSLLQVMDRGQKKILPKIGVSEGEFWAKKPMIQ